MDQPVDEGLDAFLRSASHDLKAPLRHIQNFTRFVREGADDRLTDEEKSDLQRVMDAAAHMTKLIESLSNYARLGSVSVQRQQVPLSAIVDAIIGQLPPQQAEAIHVGDLCDINGDRELLTTVMRNLIDNALLYVGDQSPDVTIQAESSAEGTHVSVKDRGIGIDRKQWDRMFEPGARGVALSEFPGTGYGLATAARIVRAHAGKIWVESALGQGSTFHFVIP